jgi:Ca2+-binding RTX toxin-like protein
MARIKLGVGATYDVSGGHEWYEQFSTVTLSSEQSTEARFEDNAGNSIVMDGQSLDSSDLNDIQGKVSHVTIEDSHGRLIFDISNLSTSYSELLDAVTTPGQYTMLDTLQLLIAGNDKVTGTNGSEQLMTSPDLGNDTILGLGGNDFFRAGPGDNILKGGAGVDQLVYNSDWWAVAPQTTGVVLDTAHRTAVNPWGGHDAISGFEEFTASKRDDVLKGSGRDEKFDALAGDDVVDGRGGVDAIDYSHDDHYGGHAGITADLASGKITDGFGDADKVSHVESIMGTKYADTILGSGQNEFFRGLAGNDVLNGRGGADRFLFIEGFDSDKIVGFEATGSQHDVIQFNDVADVNSFSELQNGHMHQQGNDVVIDMGGGDVLTLEDVTVGTLAANDFYFG